MSKTRVLYNTVGVFAGPAPASGGHFFNIASKGSSNIDDPTICSNLVFPLNRVTQLSYNLSIPRTDIKGLGYQGTISRPTLLPPAISLNFSYYQMGLINEARLGFNVNQPSGFDFSGPSIYSTYTCPFSGFFDRTFKNSTENTLGWPLTYRDCRNLFVATRKDYFDLLDQNPNYYYKSNEVDVYAFGNCYLNNYRTSCSVGQFPQASVEFICENLVCYDNGSGKNIPAVNAKDFSLIPSRKFNIPNTFQGSGEAEVVNNQIVYLIMEPNKTGANFALEGNPSDPTVLLLNFASNPEKKLPTILMPYDISVNIGDSNNNVPLIDLNDIKIQSYNIQVDLPREPLYNLGYKLPMDRQINLPLYANAEFSVIVGDSNTGILSNFLNQDQNYDISLKLKYGDKFVFNGIGIQYDFLNAKFNGISIQEGIGQSRIATMSFTSEIVPNKSDRGFFISGQLGVPYYGNFDEITMITQDQNDFAFQDGSTLLKLSDATSRPIY